jgi:hypothetical protein
MLAKNPFSAPNVITLDNQMLTRGVDPFQELANGAMPFQVFNVTIHLPDYFAPAESVTRRYRV